MYTKKTEPVSSGMLDEIGGTVQGHRDGHGFVLRDDGQADIYLPPDEMRAVLHRDRVKVRIVRHDRRGRPEGRVLEIVERPALPIIGRLLQEGGIWLLVPEDKRYGQDVLIARNALGQARAGQVVVADLIEPPALYGQPVGRVIEVLGEIDDPGMEIEIAVRKYGVPHVFSDAAMAQAQTLPEGVLPKDWKGRVDLTDVPLVTIDGEDARDFDDAVYCTPVAAAPSQQGRGKNSNGGWRLLVAIADVSHYVQTGCPIDVDAYDRATSVYFPRRVIPMLPEKLSNGLCSLNPQVERLCMVCDMLIATDGQISAYQFYPAVMFSHARLTYTEVAAILTNTRGPEAIRRQERVADLLHLHDAYRALLKARARRGAVDFETTETQIICDESGRIERIEPRTRNDAHKLIEEAMLAANVCAAEFLLQGKQPGLYRVHEGPTPEKLDILQNYLKAMGLGYPLPEEPQPREFQRISEGVKDRPDAEQIHMMLLRSMSQAIYTPVNSGHFGLAHPAYTHFTSPIRRYPDLLVHRVIKAILAGGKYRLPKLPVPGEAHEKLNKRLQKNNAMRGGGDATGKNKKLSADMQAWQAAGLHCSANERRADEASRDVQAWLKCNFMREHLGEEYPGAVSAVTSFGLFVTLQDLYVEGLIHITELGGEYFRFDEARQELRGERTGIRYAIGTRVRVQVSRVDLDARKIDFRLVTASETLLTQALREKGATVAAARKSKDKNARQTTVASGAPASQQATARKTAARGKDKKATAAGGNRPQNKTAGNRAARKARRG